MLTLIIVLAIEGLIVGALARLALPGPDPMGIFATIMLGLGGSFLGGLACSTPNCCCVPIWSGSMPARFSRSRYCSTPKPRSGKRYASLPQSGRFWTKRR